MAISTAVLLCFVFQSLISVIYSAPTSISFQLTNQWNNGAIAAIQFISDENLNGWTLEFAFGAAGQIVSSAWPNIGCSQSGQHVTCIKNPGSSLSAVNAGNPISFSIQYSHSGNNPSPIRGTFLLNGIGIYDYIIVGGGLAGSVLASRLSENPQNTVALLEAGSDQSGTDLTEIPRNWDLTPLSKIDWLYDQEASSGGSFISKENRFVSAGKALGGTSAINTMLWNRGNPEDQNSWARSFCQNPQNCDISSNPWSYAKTVQYFVQKIENNVARSGPTRGIGGKVTVNESQFLPPFDEFTRKAAVCDGIPNNNDVNSGNQIGSSWYEYNVKAGHRQSAYVAYLKDIIPTRKNLKVLPAHFVLTLLTTTNANGKYIKGVNYEARLTGKCGNLYALKEVIVSAGAIRSPQLLMLSGIGPADHLNSLGIPVFHDLPGVGSNLQDHPLTVLGYADFTFQWSYSGANAKFGDESCSQANYNRWKNGDVYDNPCSTPSGRTIWNFKTSFADDERPDIQTINTQPPFSFAIAYLNRPRSKGTIRLFSRDPTDQPIIKLAWYDDPKDLHAMREGLKRINKIIMTQFNNASCFVAPTGQPVPLYQIQGPPAWDDAAIELWAAGQAPFSGGKTNSGMHLVGTCKMGPDFDPSSVVNMQLKVRGIQNLRVIDASIMPTIPTGNTQAPTYLVAERGAAFIDSTLEI